MKEGGINAYTFEEREVEWKRMFQRSCIAVFMHFKKNSNLNIHASNCFAVTLTYDFSHIIRS